jgi:hypothetical protein
VLRIGSARQNARVTAIANPTELSVREVGEESRAVIERLAQLERRGQGVGHQAALELFRQRPGRWGIGFQNTSSRVGSVR